MDESDPQRREQAPEPLDLDLGGDGCGLDDIDTLRIVGRGFVGSASMSGTTTNVR